MKAITDDEFVLLDEILRRGDFEGYEEQAGEDHPQWTLFEQLSKRGYVDWTDGPITREIAEDPETAQYIDEGPFDPCLTQLGHTAVMCWRAAHTTTT